MMKLFTSPVNLISTATVFLVCIFASIASAEGAATKNYTLKVLQEDIVKILENLPEDQKPKTQIYSKEKGSYSETLEPDDITHGVISDYVEIIKFLQGRMKLRANERDPENPRTAAQYHLPLKNKKSPRIIFHHKAYYSFESGDGFPTFPQYERKVVRFQTQCTGECAKLLFEGYTDSIVYVSIHPETRKIIPESIIEFRRGSDCKLIEPRTKSGGLDYTAHALPALDLCIETPISKDKLNLPNSDGLHVYSNMSSPYWPNEFEADHIAIGPSTSRSPFAFEALAHTKTILGTFEHRALGLKVGGVPEDLSVKYEHICLGITPPLPKAAIEYLAKTVIEEKTYHHNYLNKSITIKDGYLCHGKPKEPGKRGFFDRWDTANGKMDYAAIFTPQQIEDNLKASLERVKGNGEDAVTQRTAIADAIETLQDHHPGFKNDIAHRIAPVLVEVAKHNMGSQHKGAQKVLMRMPHKSMAPYLDDLISIIEDRTEALGCEDLKCPKDIKGHHPILWSLAEILNGAGPAAAPFLDRLQTANEEAGGSMGASWFAIGGGRRAAGCIGEMGPVMEEAIARNAYTAYQSDNKYSFDGLKSLRMTDQRKKARGHVEGLLEIYAENVKDPKLDPRWAKTGGLYQTISAAKQALLHWDETTPYCPTRGNL